MVRRLLRKLEELKVRRIYMPKNVKLRDRIKILKGKKPPTIPDITIQLKLLDQVALYNSSGVWNGNQITLQIISSYASRLGKAEVIQENYCVKGYVRSLDSKLFVNCYSDKGDAHPTCSRDVAEFMESINWNGTVDVQKDQEQERCGAGNYFPTSPSSPLFSFKKYKHNSIAVTLTIPASITTHYKSGRSDDRADDRFYTWQTAVGNQLEISIYGSTAVPPYKTNYSNFLTPLLI